MSEQLKHYRKTLDIDLTALDHEDFPDQNAEYRMQRVTNHLLDFVWRAISETCISPQEERVLALNIAHGILETFRGRAQSALLSKRLADRFPKTEAQS